MAAAASTAQQEDIWHPDLIKIGYPGNATGIVPSPAVQVVLASVDGNEFHELAIKLDMEAVQDGNIEGTLPLLMDTLALDDWLKLAATYHSNPEAGLEMLRKVHRLLPKIVENDAIATEKAEAFRASVAKALGLHVAAGATPAAEHFKEDAFVHPLASKAASTSASMRKILEQTKAS